MTVPPLPAQAALRIRLDYAQVDSYTGGNRLFFTYSGSAPTAANCATLATDVATAWNTNMAPVTPAAWSLNEVDVLDIASHSGASGVWTGAHPGTRSGNALTANCAFNIEFGILRRYRGGKPRVFLPPGTITDLADQTHWSASYVTAVNTGWAAFIAAIEALSIGAIGTLSHVNLSYYSGFTNIINSSGRERAVPKYRDTALVDTITGYNPHNVVASQRKRRLATTY
jgi:hypothetical protein